MPTDTDKPHESRSAYRNSSRWRPGEPLPWAKFDWRAWLSNPAIRRLSPEQRGRLMDVVAATHGTKTPGTMTELDVRLWCGYSETEWKAVRMLFEPVFNTTRRRGKWILEDITETWRASCERVRAASARAKKASEEAARKRRSDNKKDPARWPQGDLEGLENGPPRDHQGHRDGDIEFQRVRSSDPEQSAVPEVHTAQSAQNGSGGLASAGTGDTTAGHAALLARALGAGTATGTDGTDATRGGGA